MKRMMRRLFALLMAAMMLCGSLPLSALAEIAPSDPIEEHSQGVLLMSALGDDIEGLNGDELVQVSDAYDDAASYFGMVTGPEQVVAPYAVWLINNGGGDYAYGESPTTVNVGETLRFALYFFLEYGYDAYLENARLTLKAGDRENEEGQKLILNSMPLTVTKSGRSAGFYCDYTVDPKDQFVELSIDGYGASSESTIEPIYLDVEDAPAYTVTKTLLNGASVSVTDTDEEPGTYKCEYNPDGDNTLTYELVVTNTGNTDLDLVVSNTLNGDDLNSQGDRNVDDSGTLSVSYNESNTELPYTYSYEVLSTDKQLEDVTTISVDSEEKELEIDITVADYPHLSVENVETSEQPEDGYGVGDTIKYTITVSNDGNVPVTNITVTDKNETNEEDQKTILSTTIASLQPGEQKDFDVQIGPLMEQDILRYNGDGITTIANAQGTAQMTEGAPELVSADEAEVTVDTVEADRTLHVTKETAEPMSGVKVGDVITYKITVTGSNNLTVKDITVTDPLTKLNQSVGTLIPGAIAGAIETTYTVTQADVDAGQIVNTATAEGTDVNGDPVKGEHTATVTTIAADPALTVTNTANKASGAALGEEITYTITVKNTGNVTVSDITVTDPKTGLNETIESLAPDASTEYTTTHTITEADILVGSFENTATATGTPARGGEVTNSGTATVNTVAAAPALTVSKTADKTTDAKLNDVITYTITVTNSGNVTVNDITVNDDKTGQSWTITSLAPNASDEHTVTYTVTQADVDAGSFVNTATATGTGANGEPATNSGSATVTTVEQNPALTVEKKADKTEGAALGEEITYTITVKNSGNVTVSDITVTDPLTGLNETIESLAPSGSKEYTTKHTITEADILDGSFVNTATAKGTAPGGEPVTGSDDETVTTVAQAPALTVVKTANKTSGAALGEEITYTITVKNSGNVTVSGITVTDPLTGLNETIESLAPGESKEYTTTHKITEDDILAGSFENTATAKGTDPKNGEVTGSDDETVTTVAQAPALTVEKKADKTSDAELNDVITYTITVTNSGNVTVSDITVTDDPTGLNQNVGTLAPSESTSVTTAHTITEADILDGSFVNTATATGKDPNGGEVTGSDDETVTTAAQAPALTVVKTAGPGGGR